MLPSTIAPISGHHRSGSFSQSQDHQQAQGAQNHSNYQVEGPQPSFDTRGRPVPAVCFDVSQIFVFLIDRAHKKRWYNLLGTNLLKTSSSLMIQRERRNLIMNSSSLISIVKVDWRRNKLCIFWSTLPRFSRQRLIWFLWRVLLQVGSCCLHWSETRILTKMVFVLHSMRRYSRTICEHLLLCALTPKTFAPQQHIWCSMIWWNCSRWGGRWRKVRIFSLGIMLIEEISVSRYALRYSFSFVLWSLRKRFLLSVSPIPICSQNLESKQTGYVTR